MKTTTHITERLIPFIILLLILPSLGGLLGCYAQAPDIEWAKTYGGSAYEYARSIEQTADGGYIVAGHSNSTNSDINGQHVNSDMWVVKLHANGDLDWQNSLGGSNIDVAYSIQQTNDGGYIVAGSSSSTDGDVTGNHGGRDMWVVKLFANGNLDWQKSLGGSNTDIAESIRQTNDGGYIVAGSSYSNNGDVSGNHGGRDMWVVKLDTNGNLEWQKSLGGSGEDAARSIEQTADGGYIVVGRTTSNNGDVTVHYGSYDVWLVKLFANGNLDWQKSLGGSLYDDAWAIEQTADGGYIVAGQSDSIDGDVSGNIGSSDMWVIKLDANGEIDWEKSLGGGGLDFAHSIDQTTDGGYIVAGYTNSTNGDVTVFYGGYDMWVVKLQANGDLEWQKSLGGSNNDVAFSIRQTIEGSYIVAGFTDSTDGDVIGNQGGDDMWVVKLHPDSLSVEDVLVNQISIYPNPASDFIYIQTVDTIENIQVFDILGKQISISQPISEINSTKKLNLEQVRSGVYVIAITTNIQTYMFKIMKK